MSVRRIVVALCAVVASTVAVSSSGFAQDHPARTLARGDRYLEADVGFSWYSPRGGSWGMITNRRVYLSALRGEWIIRSEGRLAWAYTMEWVPLAVVERTNPQQTLVCYDTPEQRVCEVDRSARVAVGTGFSPFGIKTYLNPESNTRFFLNASGGMIAFSSHVPVYSSRRVNFMLDYGGGIEIAGHNGHAMTMGYRFNHVSNAGTGRVNPGLDANVFYVGLRKRR